MWSQFMNLFPSIAIYFGLSLLLCLCGWLLLKKLYTSIQFSIFLPFGFAMLMTVHFVGNNFIFSYMNNRTPAALAKNQVAPDPQTLAKMKTDFLTIVDAMMANPQQITVQTKQQVLSRYNPLFMTPDVKKAYENNIGAVYVCQRAFYEDALASLKNKKPTTSDIRKRCYEMDGKFFGREKLIPEEMVKANNETIEKIAKGKPIKQGDKESVVTAKVLEEQVSAFNLKVQAVKAIFQ